MENTRKSNFIEKREEFADMLMAHNWTYYRSDDENVKMRGGQSYVAIRLFLKHNKDEFFKEMFNKANPFSSTQTII